MTLKIGVVIFVYKQPRYKVQIFEKNKEVFGWVDTTHLFTLAWLQKNATEIESAEFWANATPVPIDMLNNVAKFKEILGKGKCL